MAYTICACGAEYDTEDEWWEVPCMVDRLEDGMWDTTEADYEAWYEEHVRNEKRPAE